MSKTERLAWIMAYITHRDLNYSGPYTVDVLHSDFVFDYIDFSDAEYDLQFYGAPKCSQLGRDLATLHGQGKLTRYATGLQGMAGMGFPRWVYTYKLADRSHLKGTE